MKVYYPNNQWTFYMIPPLIVLVGLCYLLSVKQNFSWILIGLALFSFLFFCYCLYARFATKLTIYGDRLELRRNFQRSQSLHYIDHDFVIGPAYDTYKRQIFSIKYAGRSNYFFIYPLDKYGNRMKILSIALELDITKGHYKKIQKDLSASLATMDLLGHLCYNNDTIIVRNR
ncbi:hypothetical protein [Sphingobacterium sp. HMA12]|uniref:hypothetical protein n=1 Tax=Sphingobacterium sp. HMA12 TaxID=2050894 RepID=UPI000CE9C3B4|nr:hypothetical protein [Sphingobacterium sp. HMA12]